MPTTTLNGVEHYYERTGSGAPLLFIHGGFGGVSTSVDPGSSPVLASIPLDRYEAVTYDRRSAGRSAYCLDWYTLADLASDAHALMASLGFDEYVVVGSSMGGMVAQQFTLTYPDAVRAVAFMNTGPNLMADTRWGRSFVETAERVRATGDDVEFERVVQKLRKLEAAGADEAARARFRDKLAILTDAELKRMHSGTVRNYGAFAGYDFRERLGEITQPALVVHGSADSTVAIEDAYYLRDHLPDARFVEVAGAEHGILGYADAQAALRDWLLELGT